MSDSGSKPAPKTNDKEKCNHLPNWGMQAMSLFCEMYDSSSIGEYWREKLAEMLGIRYEPMGDD